MIHVQCLGCDGLAADETDLAAADLLSAWHVQLHPGHVVLVQECLGLGQLAMRLDALDRHLGQLRADIRAADPYL